MSPDAFPEANGTLSGGPAELFGAHQIEPNVSDLPVYRGHGEVISCWRLTWLERIRLLFSGRVWLRVVSQRSHSPVLLTTERPFQ